jgi:hypothetical protein
MRAMRLSAGFLTLLTLAWFLSGAKAAPREAHGLPTDWTHRHLVFSRPKTDADWQRVSQDRRFWQQGERRNFSFRHKQFKRGDWSINLGSGGTPSIESYAGKYTLQTSNASCGTDYVVYSTGLAGSGTQADIVSFTNIYSGCGGTVPQVDWAYNTGGTVLTSPVFSEDGKQVAFVQTSGGAGILVLLKWKAATGSIGAPLTPTNVPASTYSSCAAPCMTQITLKTSGGVAVDDTTSSVFYVYGSDIIWVGSATGWLHKIAPVFTGVPAEVTTGGFPVQVHPANPQPLSSPVFDSVTNTVFVGDYRGFVYRVSATGGVVRSGRLDVGTGFVSGPIVDSTAGQFFVFSSDDGSRNCGGGPCSGVFRFATNFGGGTKGTERRVGASSNAPNALYSGAIDDAYLNTGNGSLYVCGNTGGDAILYKIPITTIGAGIAVRGPTLSSVPAGCSPLTDVYNPNAAGGANEWVFASVQSSGSGSSCAGNGCVMNFLDNSWLPSNNYTAGQEVLDSNFQIQVVATGGTSGAAAPTWSTTVNAITTDGGMKWLDQGPLAASYATRLSRNNYAVGDEIVDTNGNIQVVTAAGTSGAGAPTWSTAVNTSTADGGVTWNEIGAVATHSLAASGGTTGFIIDNLLNSPTGASQLYFRTLSDQICATSGTFGGCAVQASQSTLQ